jgi:hypothetical protein
LFGGEPDCGWNNDFCWKVFFPVSAARARTAGMTKSVSTEPPGDRLLTVTPVSGRSCAQANVMVSSAALVGP